MEKKIEIGNAHKLIEVNGWFTDVIVDKKVITRSFGDSKEEAQQNARIAAKGYLVEELVKHLKDYRGILSAAYQENSDEITELDNLLTKAETFNT